MNPTGRKPKPVELRALEGGAGKGGRDRGHRPRKDPPKFAPLTEHPPDEMHLMGKSLWRRLMKEFGRTQLVQRTDREALIALCDLWGVYCQNMALVREHGTLMRSGHHNSERSALVINPAWRVARDALREMENLWSRFGLTPSDRARFGVKPKDDDESPISALLTGGGE